MPNRPAHDLVGCFAGATATAALAPDGLPAFFRARETASGGIGGVWGSRIPDSLEPATRGPNHRAFAHSLVAGASSVIAARAHARQGQAFCRARAAQAVSGALEHAPGCPTRLWLQLVGFFFTILAGLLAGVAAGFISHLVLDGLTPAGLPFL